MVSRGGKKTHGMRLTKIYKIWSSMKNRCLNPNNHAYKHYGARGITVCDRWMKFENFYEDMGDIPLGLTLERINNDWGYEPFNCKWATRSEQQKNKQNRKRVDFPVEVMLSLPG